MDAEVGVGVPVPPLVHPEELGALHEEVAGQQLLHGVQFVLDLQAGTYAE